MRWNYSVLVADGASFLAGLAFVSQESVLPNMIRELGGADWMVALSPALYFLGTMMTPLLLVHHVEKLTLYRGFTLRLSMLQRSAPLLCALALLFAYDKLPGPTVTFAALTPLLVGILGGLCTPSFWQLYGKILPPNRRASNSALRYGLGLLIGCVAGFVISTVLAKHPGNEGYGILFFLQFLGMALSGVFFFLVRELPDPPHAARPHRSLGDVLRVAPQVLREEKSFRRFLASRAFGQAHFILLPFLALEIRAKLQLPESFLGQLVVSQMIGGLLGGAIAGFWGDKSGSLGPIRLARFIVLALCLGCFWISQPWMALGAFFLVGVFVNILNISENTFVMDLVTPERLPALIAMQSLLLMPATLLFGLVSKWLHQCGPGLGWHCLATGLLVGISLLLLRHMPDPRTHKNGA